jgi:hypothetical protein
MSPTDPDRTDRAKLRDLIAVKCPADPAVLLMLVLVTVLDVLKLVR